MNRLFQHIEAREQSVVIRGFRSIDGFKQNIRMIIFYFDSIAQDTKRDALILKETTNFIQVGMLRTY